MIIPGDQLSRGLSALAGTFGSGQTPVPDPNVDAMAELVQAGSAAIEVHGLTKSYDNLHAVRGIDLTVERGQIFALLGPNGAGKTTTVEILEGYRPRDGGPVKVLGYDPARQRKRLKRQIGIVLQSSGMDRYLTVSETVAMYAGCYPRPPPSGRGHRDGRARGLARYPGA